ncbi:MAG: phage major capsid protein [Enterococcus lemanii]|jgi:HK97 family phage major capsid protein
MGKEMLLRLKKRNEKRLEKLRSKVEGTDLTEEELNDIESEIDELTEELQGINSDLEQLEEDELDPADNPEPEPQETPEPEGDPQPENRDGMITQERRDGVLGKIREGMKARSSVSKQKLQTEIRKAFANFVVGNISAMEARQLGIEAGQGSVTIPDFMSTEIISYSQEENFLRRLGTVVKTKGNVKYPVLVKKAAAQGHKKERTSANPIPEADIEFDEIYLEPTEFDALATVTKKLLKQTGLPIEDIVMDELKKAYTRKETQYMVHGDETDNVNPGALIKKAVTFTPDVAETVLFDQLISMKNSVPKVVRKKARWVLNTAAITKIEKMKTTDGFPLLKPLEQAQDGCEYKLLGYLVEEQDEVSVAGSEDQAEFYFGDFKSFFIQDVIGALELEILREKFSDTNRVGFKLYNLLDAQLIYSPFEPTVYHYSVQ